MYWVLPFFTGSYCFYWVLKGLIGFSWVSLTLIRSRWFRLDCTGFYRVLSEWQSSLVRLALDGHASITGRPFKFFYRTRLAFIEFNRSYLTGTGFFFALIDLHSVRTSLLPATIKFYCAPPGGTGFYRVLLGFTGFYWVLLGFTGFYWVLLGFTGFYRVLLGFTGFCLNWIGFFGEFRVTGRSVPKTERVGPVATGRRVPYRRSTMPPLRIANERRPT